MNNNFPNWFNGVPTNIPLPPGFPQGNAISTNFVTNYVSHPYHGTAVNDNNNAMLHHNMMMPLHPYYQTLNSATVFDTCAVCNELIDCSELSYQVFNTNQRVHMKCNSVVVVPSSTPAQYEPAKRVPVPTISCTIHDVLARFQLANYNVYPAPKVSLSSALEFRCLGKITLVMKVDGNWRSVPNGIQACGERYLEAGATNLTFPGVKFAKMSNIKSEIKEKFPGKKADFFKLKINFGDNTYVYSSEFKLVSSCTQIPEDIRDLVRPACAKRKRVNSLSPVETRRKSENEIETKIKIKPLHKDDSALESPGSNMSSPLSDDIPVFLAEPTERND